MTGSEKEPDGLCTRHVTLPGPSPGFLGTARESTVNSVGESKKTAANQNRIEWLANANENIVIDFQR